MNREQELMTALAQVSTGFDYDTVINACGQLIANGLRQKHPRIDEAEEQLDALAEDVKQQLRRHHYHEDGSRNDRRIVLPPLRELLRG